MVLFVMDVKTTSPDMDSLRKKRAVTIELKPKSILVHRTSSVALKNELLLHEACIKNNLAAVKTLLEMKVDVNSRSHMNRSPLHWAVAYDYSEITALLIKAKCDLEASDKYGSKAILMAATLGHKDALQQLIKAGANAYATNKQGGGLLHCAVENNQLEIINYIIDSLENFNLELGDKNNRTGLHLAAQSGSSEVLDKLIRVGCSVNAKDKQNETPLHLAVKSCHLSVVERLLKAGSEINEADVDGRIPLHVAAASGELDIVKTLVEHHADSNKSMDNGWTPLHCAVHAGYPAVVEHLIDNGADKHRQATNGDSPLHIAIISNKDETAKVLLTRGANINATNNRQQTPLHLASEQGNSELVEYLLISGADINIKDKSGKAALAIAARGSFILIVDTIIKVDRKSNCETSVKTIPLDLSKLNSTKTEAKYENLRQILWFVATKQLKQGEWKKLAYHWKFTQEQIKAIEHQYIGPSSYKEHGYRMLLTWLSGLEYDNNVTVTKELYESLVAIGKKDVAGIWTSYLIQKSVVCWNICLQQYPSQYPQYRQVHGHHRKTADKSKISVSTNSK